MLFPSSGLPTVSRRRLGRPRSAKETGKLQPLVVIGRDASPAPKQNEFQASRPSGQPRGFVCLSCDALIMDIAYALKVVRVQLQVHVTQGLEPKGWAGDRSVTPRQIGFNKDRRE